MSPYSLPENHAFFRRRDVLRSGALAFPVVALALAQPVQIVKVPKGQTADLWYGVNVAGRVHLRIVTRDGGNKMKLSWIKWGVGSVEELGLWGPAGELQIPITWWKGTISAKLRGLAESDTVVYISDKVEIDKTVTFSW